MKDITVLTVTRGFSAGRYAEVGKSLWQPVPLSGLERDSE